MGYGLARLEAVVLLQVLCYQHPCPVKPSAVLDLQVDVAYSTVMLHVPNQLVAAVELFVTSVQWRKPEAGKPMAMKVVQIMGYLFAEIFQRCFNYS